MNMTQKDRSSEKGEAGGTLLYSSPLSSYNPSYTAGHKRP